MEVFDGICEEVKCRMLLLGELMKKRIEVAFFDVFTVFGALRVMVGVHIGCIAWQRLGLIPYRCFIPFVSNKQYCIVSVAIIFV